MYGDEGSVEEEGDNKDAEGEAKGGEGDEAGGTGAGNDDDVIMMKTPNSKWRGPKSNKTQEFANPNMNPINAANPSLTYSSPLKALNTLSASRQNFHDLE